MIGRYGGQCENNSAQPVARRCHAGLGGSPPGVQRGGGPRGGDRVVDGAVQPAARSSASTAPAAGQRPLDRRAVPVVPGDEEPVAERDRLAQPALWGWPCGGGAAGTETVVRWIHSAVERPYSRSSSRRISGSSGACGPTTEVATGCHPAGAYVGAAWLGTTVLATSFRRSPSSSRIGSARGACRCCGGRSCSCACVPAGGWAAAWSPRAGPRRPQRHGR